LVTKQGRGAVVSIRPPLVPPGLAPLIPFPPFPSLPPSRSLSDDESGLRRAGPELSLSLPGFALLRRALFCLCASERNDEGGAVGGAE
jgi:hypothetical protein